MFSKILVALQNTLRQHPNTVNQGVGLVQNGLNWLNRQPFGAEVKEMVRRISFTINLGSFPEFGTNSFTVTKQSGSMTLFGTTERRSNFALSLQGFMDAAKRQASVKRTDATQKAQEAKRRAEEAQRLAAEAAELARVAAADADSYESAVGALNSVGSRF